MYYRLITRIAIILGFVILSCELPVNQFEDIEDGILYKAKQIESPQATVSFTTLAYLSLLIYQRVKE